MSATRTSGIFEVICGTKITFFLKPTKREIKKRTNNKYQPIFNYLCTYNQVKTMNKAQIIDLFTSLGERLATFGNDELSRQTLEKAMADNSWFSEIKIRQAIDALRVQMLDKDKLCVWFDRYPSLPTNSPRKVLVVMAGNIPLVGFFDLLCVVASGNRCLVKPSSKDQALMQYIVDQLLDIAPHTAIELFDGQTTPDAVIATGSDNAVRHFRTEYGQLSLLLRGSRSSCAILTGEEASEDLSRLCNDIYMYSGLGCRNVSLIFVPDNYDIAPLANALQQHPKHNIGYLNNYRQRKALMQMNGVEHTDLGHSLLIEEQAFPTSISQINIARYSSLTEVAEWLADHDEKIQCVACNDLKFTQRYAQTCQPLLRAVPIGTTQTPALTDYPDAADVMEWLKNLA